MEPNLASKVWMVHAFTGMAGRRGTLSIEGGGLSFRPDASRWPATDFPFADITRVRRVRGSPVLEIAISRQGVPPLVGFYFIKPPELPGEEDTGFLQRRRVRKLALNSLRTANSDKKREIAAWVEAINEGKGSSP